MLLALVCVALFAALPNSVEIAASGTRKLVSPYGHRDPWVSSDYDHDDRDGVILGRSGAAVYMDSFDDNHFGIDWLITDHRQVVSATDGIVASIVPSSEQLCWQEQRTGSSGESVIVLSDVDGSKVEFEYSSIEGTTLTEGNSIAAGDPIGFPHSTGCMPHPFFHFSVRISTLDGWCSIDPAGVELEKLLGGRLIPHDNNKHLSKKIMDEIVTDIGKLLIPYDLPLVSTSDRRRCVARTGPAYD
jgi:hypothetical protein